jgi:transposase
LNIMVGSLPAPIGTPPKPEFIGESGVDGEALTTHQPSRDAQMNHLFKQQTEELARAEGDAVELRQQAERSQFARAMRQDVSVAASKTVQGMLARCGQRQCESPDAASRGDEMLRPAEANSPAALLMQLKGIGAEFATVLYLEGLFRHFENRRQLAAYAGLGPSPWKSGTIDHEQGISKAGNPRLRS